MFKRDVQSVKDLILRNLREQGLEMPLLQKRLVEAWPQIVKSCATLRTIYVSPGSDQQIEHVCR